MTDEEDFWNFSVSVYDRARESCLNLQDRFGFDVNLLLFCCWRGAAGVGLGEAELKRIIEGTAAWRINVIEPLRATRRWLRNGDHPSGAKELRARILEIELQGERLAQALIIEAAGPRPDPLSPCEDIGIGTARRNLEMYQRAATPGAMDASAPVFLELLEGVFAVSSDEVIVAGEGHSDA
jgi:uncharacterized protein (TIGR02444 family)